MFGTEVNEILGCKSGVNVKKCMTFDISDFKFDKNSDFWKFWTNVYSGNIFSKD